MATQLVDVTMNLTNYRVGEDVIVQHDAVLDGKGFLTQIEEIAYSTLVVDVRDREVDGELLHVLPERVTELEEVVDL